MGPGRAGPGGQRGVGQHRIVSRPAALGYEGKPFKSVTQGTADLDAVPLAEEAEADAPISQLEKFLAEAKGNKDWKLATRLYFLMVLGQLSERHLIRWQRDKTNRQYSLELTNTAPSQAPVFKKLSSFYEQVWYGERVVNEADFNTAEKYFRQFLTDLEGRQLAA